MILRLISDDHTLLQRFIPVYRPKGKERELLRWKDLCTMAAPLRQRRDADYRALLTIEGSAR